MSASPCYRQPTASFALTGHKQIYEQRPGGNQQFESSLYPWSSKGCCNRGEYEMAAFLRMLWSEDLR